MSNKFKIKSVDILNIKGLNTITLSGNMPLFTDGNVNVQVNCTAEDDTGSVIPPYSNFNTSVSLNKADLTDTSENGILAAVCKELGITLDTTKKVKAQ